MAVALLYRSASTVDRQLNHLITVALGRSDAPFVFGGQRSVENGRRLRHRPVRVNLAQPNYTYSDAMRRQ